MFREDPVVRAGIRGSPGGACWWVLVPPLGSGILLLGGRCSGRILLFAPGIRGSPGGADSSPLTFPCDTGFSSLRGRIGERCYGRKTLRSTLAGHRLSSPENPFAPPRCQGPFFQENPLFKPRFGLFGVTRKASRRILLFGRFEIFPGGPRPFAPLGVPQRIVFQIFFCGTPGFSLAIWEASPHCRPRPTSSPGDSPYGFLVSQVPDVGSP